MTDEPLPPGMAALWSRRDDDRSRPGRRPGLSVGQVTAAGVALADAEGLGTVSMARVAERLGVTTMALYRYVGSKDELLALMYDAALAPPDRPGPAGESMHAWRDRLTAWCRAQLELIAAHPWTVRLSTLRPIGPHRLGWIEHGLAAFDDTRLPEDLKVALIGMLSLHVFAEGQLIAAVADQQAGRTGEHPALVDYASLLRSVVDPEEHPRVAGALAQGAFDTDPDADPRDQPDFALGLLLDGIAALVDRFEQEAEPS